MQEKIFPKNIINEYNGYKLALINFGLITFVTIIRSLIHMFLPDGGANSIAGIPLQTYSIAPGAIGNYIMVPLALIMFFLSVERKK